MRVSTSKPTRHSATVRFPVGTEWPRLAVVRSASKIERGVTRWNQVDASYVSDNVVPRRHATFLTSSERHRTVRFWGLTCDDALVEYHMLGRL